MNLNLQILLLSLVFTAFWSSNAKCSTNVKISTKFDSLNYRFNNNDIEAGKLIDFRFPPLEMLDSYKFKSVEGVKLNNYKLMSTKAYGCEFKLKQANYLNTNKKEYLKVKCYVKNIDTLFFSLSVSAEEYFMTSINLKNNRDYFVLDIPLEKFYKKVFALRQNSDSLLLEKINIYTGYAKTKKLIIGDICIYTRFQVSANSEDEFYQQILNSIPVIMRYNSLKGFCTKELAKNVNLFEESGIELFKYPVTKEYLSKEYLSKEYLSISNPNESYDNINEVKLKVKGILEQYNSIEGQRFNSLLTNFDTELNVNNLDSFYNKLQDYLYKFNDTHLKLKLNDNLQQIKGISPLYFYEIKGDIEVIAVLDNTLFNIVSLGDRLLAINNQPVSQIIESLHEYTTGSSYHSKHRKIIQKLLQYVCLHENTDSLKLSFQNYFGENYAVSLSKNQLFHNRNLTIPQNIQDKREQYDYQRINNVSYLKISSFQDNSLRTFFYTYIDSISNSEGIVLDLRNNSTGDFSFAYLLSFFVTKPEIIFSQIKSGWDHQTFVVTPDPFYNINKPIVVLVDARTACGSEFFISALQKSKSDVWTLGASKTSGAAQRQESIQLPKGSEYAPVFYFRSDLVLDAYGENIDHKGGLTPTIWTNINSYIDLAPYNDKLLNKALKYLTTYNN